MWSTLILIFNAFGFLLLLQYLRFKYREYLVCRNEHDFWTYARHKYAITVGGMLLAAFFIIEILLPEVSPLENTVFRGHLNTYIGVATSLGISYIWARYLRKLDIFDPEKWSNIITVFALGCVTVWGVFPISRYINGVLNFQLNGDTLNDFFYCVITIGMVEEFVKLLPLLVIIRFKNVVREPYDFLFYASISALGFAFIENALYIQKTNFYSINGRALMATVAHMTFSSVVGYSVMISVYKRHWFGWRYLVGGFLLASVMLGFYDFWLINPIARKFDGLTFLFFLLTTHFWFSMKNKAINASRYFDPHRKLINDKLRYFLIFWLTALLMFSALLIGVFHGRSEANTFLRGQILAYGFLLYYLSFSFSRFKIAPKVLSKGQKAFDAVIPKEPTREAA